MKRELIDLLACPRTGSALCLRQARFDRSGDIVAGELFSRGGPSYPIIDGVPDFVGGLSDDASGLTVAAFGRQWRRFDRQSGFMASRELFLSNVPSLAGNALKGATVLEGGCGSGRWLRAAAELGARMVVGLDASEAVRVSRHNCRDLPQVHVVRGTLEQPPFRRGFDAAFSIGVIHHLDEPWSGIAGLLGCIAPGGRAAIWTYAREGNGTYLVLSRILRRITPGIPEPLLASLSWAMTIPLYAHARSTNRLLAAAGMPFPLRDYIAMLGRLEFRDLWNVVYDQLAPRIAHFPTGRELRGWIERAGGRIDSLTLRTGNSWCAGIVADHSSESLFDSSRARAAKARRSIALAG